MQWFFVLLLTFTRLFHHTNHALSFCMLLCQTRTVCLVIWSSFLLHLFVKVLKYDASIRTIVTLHLYLYFMNCFLKLISMILCQVYWCYAVIEFIFIPSSFTTQTYLGNYWHSKHRYQSPCYINFLLLTSTVQSDWLSDCVTDNLNHWLSKQLNSSFNN